VKFGRPWKIALEQDGRPLSLSRRVDGIACHPAIPIAVFLREPRQEVIFEDFPLRTVSLPVDEATRFGWVKQQLLERYKDIGTLELHWADRELRNELLVLSMDKNLESSILVKNVRMKVDQADPVVYFVHQKVEQRIPCRQNAKKVDDYKVIFAQQYQTTREKISIFLGQKPLSDNELIDPSRIYNLNIFRPFASLELRLCPVGDSRYNRTLLWTQNWPTANVTTINDLASRLPVNARPISFKVRDTPIAPDTEVLALQNRTICVEYPGPRLPTEYDFDRVRLAIDAPTTVAEVKIDLLTKLGRPDYLPGTMRLEFWGCYLSDDVPFWQYGIPEASKINVSSSEGSELHVTDRHHATSTYFFADTDTVSNLQLTVRRGSEIVFAHRGINLRPEQVLAELPDVELELVDTFSFTWPNGDIALPLPASTTVAQSISKLAEHLHVLTDNIALRTNDTVLDDPDTLIWSVAAKVTCSLQRIKVLFALDQNRFPVEIDRDIPFSEVKAQLARELNLQEEFKIFAGRSEVDDQMTVTDVEDFSELKVVITPPKPQSGDVPSKMPAAAARRGVFQVTVVLGVIPRMMSLRLPPTATLHEAEAEIQRRFGLEDIELEFILSDELFDQGHLIPKESQLGGLNLDESNLLVQLQGTAEANANGNAAVDNGEQEEGATQDVHVTCGSVKPAPLAKGMTVYNFVAPQYNEEFSLLFELGKTVLDARKAVAARYAGKTAADITLLFSGKALRDGFVLDRLRIGTGRITVYVRDIEGILIVNARANRGP
jgi:hypothetical protein